MQAVAAARGRLPRATLRRLIAAGNLAGAAELALQVWQRQTEAWQREVSLQIRDALEIGGDNAASDFNRRPPTRLQIKTAFDVTNPRATEAARAQAARLVTQVTEGTRQAIIDVITAAFTEQRTAQRMARDLREVIGLHSRDERAAQNFRIALQELKLQPKGTVTDTVLRRLSNRGLTEARIDDLVSRYRTRLLNRRAKLISRTEIQTAQNEGQLEYWRQAREDGLLPVNARKRWITNLDACLRICAPLSGVSVPLDGMFQTSVGPVERPTAHPACRCTLAIVVPSRPSLRVA